MFDIVFAQLAVRDRNKFVEVATLAERYFTIGHIQNKESKEQLFQIGFLVKLVEEGMLIKREKIVRT